MPYEETPYQLSYRIYDSLLNCEEDVDYNTPGISAWGNFGPDSINGEDEEILIIMSQALKE